MLSGARKNIMLAVVILCISCMSICELYGNSQNGEGGHLSPEIIALMSKIKNAEYEIVLKDGTRHRDKVKVLKNGFLLEKEIYGSLKDSERSSRIVSLDQVQSIRVIKKKSRWITIYLLVGTFCSFFIATAVGR